MKDYPVLHETMLDKGITISSVPADTFVVEE